MRQTVCVANNRQGQVSAAAQQGRATRAETCVRATAVSTVAVHHRGVITVRAAPAYHVPVAVLVLPAAVAVQVTAAVPAVRATTVQVHAAVRAAAAVRGHHEVRAVADSATL